MLGLLFSQQAGASEDRAGWKLVKDKNNIQVYTLKVADSDILKAKTTTIINAPMERIQALLDDVKNRHKWVPYLKKSEAITEYKNNKRLEYSLFAAPWPASDRDFVYQLELISDLEKQRIYKMVSVVSELMPENKDNIRAELYESNYTLTAINENTTRIELTFHVNPKGWLPDWLINIIQRILPYKILQNLASEAVG